MKSDAKVLVLLEYSGMIRGFYPLALKPRTQDILCLIRSQRSFLLWQFTCFDRLEHSLQLLLHSSEVMTKIEIIREIRRCAKNFGATQPFFSDQAGFAKLLHVRVGKVSSDLRDIRLWHGLSIRNEGECPHGA